MARIIRSAAATSWIDQHQQSRFPSPELGIRLPIAESDGSSDANYRESSSVSRSLITGETEYRFSNLIEGFLDVNDGKIVDYGFTSESRIYRSPSAFGLTSIVYETQRDLEVYGDRVRFTQLVGCRTRSPEVVALGAGALGGGAIGLRGGAIGGLRGRAIGGLAGALGGAAISVSIAEAITSFPPIWTEIALTICVDGSYTQELLRYSIFPSNCFFALDSNATVRQGKYNKISYYDACDGDTVTLERWYRDGWGAVRQNGGNPWCIPSPRGVDFFTRGGDIMGDDPISTQCTFSRRNSTDCTKGCSRTRSQ